MDNLSFALASVTQCNAGVYLAFHQHLIHAQTTLKQHTTELNAFTGLDAHISIQANQQSYQVTANDIAKALDFNCMSLMMQPIDLVQQFNNLKKYFSPSATLPIPARFWNRQSGRQSRDRRFHQSALCQRLYLGLNYSSAFRCH